MKILIAGLGSIGQRHARNLRTVLGDRVELLAYRVRGLPHVVTEQMTIDPSATVEDRLGIRSFTDLDLALAQRPAAVLVCNPTRLHLATALAAVHAGCDVLIEKPLSDSMADVGALIACAQSRRLIAAVAYQMRFHPALIGLRQSLLAGAIGRVRSVRAEWGEYLPDAHPYEDYRQSYAARRDLGGGVILCYIHEFDYLTWLFGMPRRVSTTGGHLSDLEIDVEDTAMTVMEYELEGRPVEVELRLCFAQRAASRTCTVEGDSGERTIDLHAPIAGGERNDLFIAVLQDFLSAVSQRRAPAVPAGESVAGLRVALAARQSLASGRSVEL